MVPMTRTKGSLAWKIFIGILAAVLVIIVVAEFGLRAYISNRIESEFASASPVPTTAGAQVSFGPEPLTFGLLGGKVPHLTLSAPSTLAIDGDSFSGLPAATAELNDVRMTDAGSIAETLDVTTELPDSFIKTVLEQQIRSVLSRADGAPAALMGNLVSISDVTSHPETGTVTIQFTEGVAAIDLRPQREGDQLTFAADSTRLFGVDLPGGVAEQLSRALHEGMRDAVFGNMRVRDVQVVEGGLLVSLSGSDVNLNEIAGAL